MNKTKISLERSASFIQILDLNPDHRTHNTHHKYKTLFLSYGRLKTFLRLPGTVGV